MSHAMTNRVWVTLHFLFAGNLIIGQSCLIPWPTEGEWHSICPAISLITVSQGGKWDYLLFLFRWQQTIPWPIDCKLYWLFYQIISLQLSSYDQQTVSNMSFSFTSHKFSLTMTNRKWVKQHWFIIKLSHTGIISSYDDTESGYHYWI